MTVEPSCMALVLLKKETRQNSLPLSPYEDTMEKSATPKKCSHLAMLPASRTISNKCLWLVSLRYFVIAARMDHDRLQHTDLEGIMQPITHILPIN